MNFANLSQQEMIDLARLNYGAGKYAQAGSAFAPASQYLLKAVEFLNAISSSSPAWTSFELTNLRLNVFSLASGVELVLGRYESGALLAKPVLESSLPQLTKLPLYAALADGLGSNARHEESMKLSMSVLEELGERQRGWKIFHLIELKTSLRKEFRKLLDEEILAFPMMEERDRATMGLLLQSSFRAFASGNMDIFIWCIVRMLKKTLQLRRLCAHSSGCFVTFGFILLGLGADPEDHQRMAALGREMARKTNAKHLHAKLVASAVSYLDAWGTPLGCLYQRLQTAYQTGMENGDLESAMLAMYYELLLRLLAGYQLDRIYADFQHLVTQTQQFNMISIEAVCRFSMEMVKDLTDNTARPAWMDTSDPTLQPSGFDRLSIRDATPLLIFGHLRRMETAFHLKNYAVADIMRKGFEQYKRKMNMFVVESTGCFFACLTCMAMAQQRPINIRQRKHFKALAQAELTKMKQWLTKRGAINIIHRFNILEAQFAVCFRQHELKTLQIKTLLDEAIVSATRAGFLNDAALVNDLAGEFMLSTSGNDNFWCKHYFTASYELYKSWGAKAKANLLLELRAPYINLHEASSRFMTTTQKSKEIVTRSSSIRISSLPMALPESFDSSY